MPMINKLTFLLLFLLPILSNAQMVGKNIKSGFPNLVPPKDSICRWEECTIELGADSLPLFTYIFTIDPERVGTAYYKAKDYINLIITRVAEWEGKNKCDLICIGPFIYYNGKVYAEIGYADTINSCTRKLIYTIKFKSIITNDKEL